MKSLLFLFAIYSTFTFAQNSTEKTIVGQWSCCSKFDLTKPQTLVLTKKSYTDMGVECTNKPCVYFSLIFEITNTGKLLSTKEHTGCKNEISNSEGTTTGWTWSLTKDNKTLILISDDKKQYKFSITSISATQLVLNKI